MLKKFNSTYPRFSKFFQFQDFNPIQSQCYSRIFCSQSNLIISAPTSSGKTVLFQLLMLKLLSSHPPTCLYLGPIKSLCQQKTNQWSKKFLSTLSVVQLTGDSQGVVEGANIYVATPEKVDFISRKNLDFLRQVEVLMIDQIHMLNMEERGAILQAIVSRIMSINNKVRIMAVSATIPNIQQVAQWLKVPKDMICVFGEEYRPAKLHKVVLGFKASNNDFSFEKMLNFKVLDIIRNYSCGGGSLIFCQTQKGTEQACHKIVSQMKPNEMIINQSTLNQLINSCKSIDNSTLRQLLPSGLAFHNASLSSRDRSLVQSLFLQQKIKILFTTSTLAMGINLPARLVIIKSTKCYKGQGKGYQEYTQIQMDQMMGRAGRVPFDREGTVVIMTEKQNYSKYAGKIQLENLESQLFAQLIDHINTQISLKSIQSLSQAISYIQNSFCYIRMLNSPKSYNLNSSLQLPQFVKKTCLQLIQKLSFYQIISYNNQSQKVHPKLLSINISKNAIQIQTIIQIIQKMQKITNQRSFLDALCGATQLIKYRSKLDQRKCLKDLNQKNKYTLNQTIAKHDKKCFVLMQAQLTGFYIDNWEMRRQAKEMVGFFGRLAYCVKSLAMDRKQMKTYWLFLFATLFHKYFYLGFWERNQQRTLRQLYTVESSWKNISTRGVRNIQDLIEGLDKLDVFGTNVSSKSLKKQITQELQQFRQCIQTTLKPNPSQGSQNNYLLKLVFTKKFSYKFKSITIMVQNNGNIYYSGFINQNNLEFTVFLKNTHKEKYFLAIVKDGIIGFDQYYWVQYGSLRKTYMKKQDDAKKIEALNESGKQNKKKFKQKSQISLSQSKNKTNNHKNSMSLSKSFKKIQKRQRNSQQKAFPRKVIYTNQNPHNKTSLKIPLSPFQAQTQKQVKPKQLTLSQYPTIKRSIPYQHFTNNQQSYPSPSRYQHSPINPLSKQMKKSSKVYKHGDLRNYNWKPGFEQIVDHQHQQIRYNQQEQEKQQEFSFYSRKKNKGWKDDQQTRHTYVQNNQLTNLHHRNLQSTNLQYTNIQHTNLQHTNVQNKNVQHTQNTNVQHKNAQHTQNTNAKHINNSNFNNNVLNKINKNKINSGKKMLLLNDRQSDTQISKNKRLDINNELNFYMKQKLNQKQKPIQKPNLFKPQPTNHKYSNLSQPYPSLIQNIKKSKQERQEKTSNTWFGLRQQMFSSSFSNGFSQKCPIFQLKGNRNRQKNEDTKDNGAKDASFYFGDLFQ